MHNDDEQALEDLAKRQRFVPTPRRIDGIVSELLTRRGYARVFSAENLLDAWQHAVPASIAGLSRPGKIVRGTLEVVVDNSAALQELTFIKQQVLQKLNDRLEGKEVRGLRIRVAPLGDDQ